MWGGFDQPGFGSKYFQGKKKPPPPKQRGKGGFLSSIISEVGGAGGAVGGAAAGAAAGSVVPGIGTLIGGLVGAGIGGFAGGTGGRLAENKIRDNEYRLGDALKEGAWSGGLGAVPIGGAVKAVRGVAKAAAGKPVKAGIIKQAGARLETRAGGYPIGAKVPGQDQLTPMASRNIQSTLSKEKIPFGGPDKRVQAVERRLEEAGSQIDEALKTGNRKFTPAEKNNIKTQYMKSIEEDISNSPTVKKHANTFLASLNKNVNDVSGLVTQKRNIERKLVNWGRSASSKTPDQEAAGRALVNTMNQVIESVTPALKSANQRYSKLRTAQDFLLDASKTANSQARNPGGGVVGRMLTGDIAQSAKSVIGGNAQRLSGGLAGAAPQILSKGVLAKELAKQTVGKAALGGGTTPPDDSLNVLQQPPAVDLEGQGEEEYTFDPESGQLVPVASEESMGGAESPASLEDALTQAQSILGEGHTPATYLSYAKAIMASSKPEKLTAARQKSVDSIGGVVDLADQIESELSQAGGGGGIKGFATQALTHVPGAASNAKAYEATRKASIAPLARAISGEVGVLTDRDIARAEGLLPRLSDTPYEAQLKLKNLRDTIAKRQSQFQKYIPRGQSGLSDMLEQYQGAYQ